MNRNGLPPHALVPYFFMTEIMERKFGFLVYHNGRLHFAKIHQSCLQQVSDILQQLPPGQSPTPDQLLQVLDCVKAFLPQLSFIIERDLVFVDWKDVIFAGEPGKRRTLRVRLLDGREVYAKYVGNQHQLFIFEVIGTDEVVEVVEVPLENILDHTQPSSDVLEKYKHELASQRELELRRVKAPFIQFPLILPGSSPYCYPSLTYENMAVLFLICEEHKFELGFNYPFNLVLIRFLACGPQEKFFHEVPQLTPSKKEAFQSFERRYNDFFMGNVMVSNIQRSSKFSEQKVFRFQFAVYKSLKIKINARCALRLSRTFWIHNEIGVVLRKGDDDFVPHSSLKRLE
jgi:hypothetical protein